MLFMLFALYGILFLILFSFEYYILSCNLFNILKFICIWCNNINRWNFIKIDVLMSDLWSFGIYILVSVNCFSYDVFFLLQIMHAGANNKNVYKSLIAAEYVGVEIKMDENFQMGVSNKTPEFLKMNPIGKVLFF